MKKKTPLEKRKIIEENNKRRVRERAQKLAEITAANKAIAFLKNEDGTHQFGENMLTLKNYKEPLKRIPESEGIGWYGTLAADVKTGKVQCHLCGEMRESLPGHIFSTHKMKTRDYREKFGLAYTSALVSENQRLRLKEQTLAWLKAMTPEEREAHTQRIKDNGWRYGQMRKTTFQPKKTVEGMNKDGSCPDQTLQAIIDAKNELGHVPSKREFIDHKGSQRYVHLAYKHFGSWTKAVQMCKFDTKDFREKINNGGPKGYKDEDLLEYLEYQQIPTATDWKRDLLPDHDTYIRHFGTIENARQLAGVYNIVELSKNMLTRSKHYRKPKLVAL